MTADNVITFLSLVAACLAWGAKILWANQYRKATDRIIESKDAEIKVLERHTKMLERVNPKKLVEWSEASLSMNKKYTEAIENQLTEANKEIEKLKGDKKEKGKKLYIELQESVSLMDKMMSNFGVVDAVTIATSGALSHDLADVTNTEPVYNGLKVVNPTTKISEFYYADEKKEEEK